MYNVYHGSWRDFTTAVGVIVYTEMNTIFGATFVGHWFVDALSANCSRETVSGEMLTGKCSVRFAHTAHASLMGAYAPKRSANSALSWEGQRSSVLCLQRMAQLSDLVIWCARNWWMFGATVFCSLRSHGTRLLLTQQSKPCLVMGKARVCACVVIS